MGDRKKYITNEIVKYSQKLDQKGFGANHDGNITALFDNTILATPTAVSKGNIISDIVITLDMDGNKISGIGKPFSEIKLHLAAYKKREDAHAIVHAHPPFATARGLVGAALEIVIPEAIVSLGKVVPVLKFAMPGATENDAIIADALMEYDVFMLPGNGVFAVGNSVEQAYLRLELVEHLAKIHYYALHMQQPMINLSDDEINKLLEKRKAAGLGPQARPPDATIDVIKKIIAEEIKKTISSEK